MPKLTLENIDLAGQFANLPVPKDYDESSAGISNKNFTCEYKGATYVDLDEVPSEDNCNSCYCDYGEIVCSKDLCTDEIPGVQSGNINTVMDICLDTVT